MKIVFCGPPHSGKSVFIANLLKKMPTDSRTSIRACPDGEGDWSNNENQEETSIVRKKGKFTDTFIENVCKDIDNQTNKIVLVDVGGVISKENEKVFRHCDSFVVLSNDEEKKKEWLEFGTNLGLNCIACLDSSLEGQEEIYARTPYLQGKIVGLDRGKTLENSSIINGLFSDIIRKSKYAEQVDIQEEISTETLIDDTELGFELGYGKEIKTDDNFIVKQVTWTEESIPQLYQLISEKVKNTESVKINGVRANFVLSSICKACNQNGIKDISLYDVRSNAYIPIKQIPHQANQRKTEGLAYHMLESEDNIFMDVDITKEKYSLEDYEKCVVPVIDENKSLYVSGRLPNWLLVSIISSYNSNRIFTFQPGKGFTCVSSTDERDLGMISSEIDGIDYMKYFEDKKNQEKSPSEKQLIVSQKQGILDKFRKIFKKIKNKVKANNQVELSNQGILRQLPNTLEEIVVPPDKLGQDIPQISIKSKKREISIDKDGKEEP